MTIFKHVLSGPNAAGDLWSSAFHTSSTAVSDVAVAHTNYQEALESALTGGILDQWAPNTHVTDLTTYQLNQTSGIAEAVSRTSVAFVGTSAGLQSGPRDCMVVGLRTPFPGPSGRGRMFLPAPALSNLTTTGLISLACRTSVADAISGMLTTLNGVFMQPGVWAKTYNVTLAFSSVTVGVVQGVQRRRSNKIPNSYYVASVA